MSRTIADMKAAAEASVPAFTFLGRVVSKAEVEVLTERRQQIERGYDAAHDDAHDARELILSCAYGAVRRIAAYTSDNHPNPRHALIQAAPMIVAEIERIDRKAEREGRR